MKMINCYLKTLKFVMYFSPWSHQATDFPFSLQPVEKPLRQTRCYKSIWVSIPATRRQKGLNGNIKKKHTTISTNCKNALIKFFRDSTDQHLIQNPLPRQALHGRFIKIRHFINTLYTICMDRYYKPIALRSF